MSRLFVEPSADADDARERSRTEATEQTSQHLISVGRPDPRSALATAGLAASTIGLLGSDGGLVWLVAGVWTVRAMAGTPLSAAWGLACLGAGFRWGTLALGDLEVATRLVGSTLTSGGPAVRAGMAAALVGALAGEAQVGGLHSRLWGERAASAIAIAALPPLFVAAGPSDPAWSEALAWALSAAVGTAVVLLAHPYVLRLPRVAPVSLTAAGILVALVAS